MHNAGAHSTVRCSRARGFASGIAVLIIRHALSKDVLTLALWWLSLSAGSADLAMVKDAREREWGIRGEKRIEERDLGEAREERTASDTRSEELARGERQEEREG